MLLTNLDPCLAAGWHPVAPSASVTSDVTEVQLLGRWFRVQRTPEGLLSDASAAADHAHMVWLAPEPPTTDLMPHPELDDPAFQLGWLEPMTTTAAAGLLADNFLDVAHFPFVHAGSFGSAEDTFVPPYEVVPDADGFSVVYEHPFHNPEDPGVAAGIRPLLQTRRVSYRYAPPFQMRLRLDHLDTGLRTIILFMPQPETIDKTTVWSFIIRDGLQGGTIDDAVAWETSIVKEDLEFSRHFTINGLPLDLSMELHLKADAAGIALRRALAALRDSAA